LQGAGYPTARGIDLQDIERMVMQVRQVATREIDTFACANRCADAVRNTLQAEKIRAQRRSLDPRQIELLLQRANDPNGLLRRPSLPGIDHQRWLARARLQCLAHQAQATHIGVPVDTDVKLARPKTEIPRPRAVPVEERSIVGV